MRGGISLPTDYKRFGNVTRFGTKIKRHLTLIVETNKTFQPVQIDKT